MEKEFILQEDSAMKIVGSLTRRRGSKAKTLKELLKEDARDPLKPRRTTDWRTEEEEKLRRFRNERFWRTARPPKSD